MSGPRLIYSRNSGQKPESAAGGTRQTQTAPDPELTPLPLGVHRGEIGLWLAIAGLIAACLVLGAL